MEPIATYDELTKMDDATFVAKFKAAQLEQAKKIKDAETESAILVASHNELKIFDETAKNQIAALETDLSLTRATIVKKYADQLAAVEMTAEKVI